MEVVILLNAPVLGGAELVAINQAIALRKSGIRVAVVAFSPMQDIEALAMLRAEGIDVLHLNNRIDSTIYKLSGLWAAGRRLESVFDQHVSGEAVVISHGEFPDLILLLFRIKKGLRIGKLRFVRTAHNERYFGKRFGWMLERFANLIFDGVIAISKRTRRLNGSSSRLIYNPVANGWLTRFDRSHRTRQEDELVFGIYGRLSHQKQQVKLLAWLRRRARQTCRFRLQLWGFEPDPQLDSLVVNTKVTIEQKGKYGRAEDVFSSVDVVLIPSAFEGLSTVMIEALAAGVPVVSLNVSGAEDLSWHSNLHVVRSFDELLTLALTVQPKVLQSDQTRLMSMFDPNRHASEIRKNFLK